jgi:hypothetical protein
VLTRHYNGLMSDTVQCLPRFKLLWVHRDPERRVLPLTRAVSNSVMTLVPCKDGYMMLRKLA